MSYFNLNEKRKGKTIKDFFSFGFLIFFCFFYPFSSIKDRLEKKNLLALDSKKRDSKKNQLFSLFGFLESRAEEAKESLKEDKGQDKVNNQGQDKKDFDQTSSLVSKSGVQFSEAGPEDITSENFPDLIQSFDYPNTPISELVKAISKLTKKNFIVDSKIGSKKISIIAPTAITVAEAYNVFLTALAMNDLTVVPTKDGKFLKIRKTSDAVRDSVETYDGEYFPQKDQLITYIFSLKYISTKEVLSSIRNLLGNQGKIVEHKATNNLIITDYGSNIDKVKMILANLDLPGNKERMEVIPILHADSEEIEKILKQVFLKGASASTRGLYRPGYSARKAGGKGGGSDEAGKAFSLILSYGRSNSIIVVGTSTGIKSIKKLIRELDIEMDPDSGGIFVYSIRYGEAKKISDILNNVISARVEEDGKGKSGSKSLPPSRLARSRFAFNRGGLVDSESAPLFSKKLKVIPDELNNNLIITGDRRDHNSIKSLLAKIDVPRHQVYLRVIILDMDVSNNMNWGINYYGTPFENPVNIPVLSATGGEAKYPVTPSFGFRSGPMSEIVESLSGGAGIILGFGGRDINIDVGGKKYRIGDVLGLVNFLRQNSNTTVLSRPQVMVMDNEEAEIVFGEEVQVGNTASSTGNTVINRPEYKEAMRKLKFTPFISSETDSVRLNIEQVDDHPYSVDKEVYAFKRRSLNSSLIIKSGDTAVLGGLMSEKEVDNVTKVPILGDLPIIGWLFRGSSKKKQKSNIFVFITPKVVRSFQGNEELLKSRMEKLREDYKTLNRKGKELEKLDKFFKDFEFEESVSSYDENEGGSSEELNPDEEGESYPYEERRDLENDGTEGDAEEVSPNEGSLSREEA